MISKKTYPFEVPELPYAYDALEPYIDKETMIFHYDKHFKTYVDNLNNALKNFPEYHSWTLERLLTGLSTLPSGLQNAVKNNGGGVYNHDMYFNALTPGGQTSPEFIEEAFGGDEAWKKQMKAAALDQFGSGFAWLVLDGEKNLKIMALPNQDNPLSLGFEPILPLDVWEHAYYLKYKNLRGDYIDNWFKAINWNFVSNLLNRIL